MKQIALVILVSLSTGALAQNVFVHEGNKQVVPVGGNAWMSTGADVLDEHGLSKWTHPESVCRVYYRASQAGTLNVSLLLTTQTVSTIRVSSGSTSVNVTTNPKAVEFPAFQLAVQSQGYVAIDIQGVSKSGETFGSLSGIAVSGTAVSEESSFVRSNEGNYFYWGRRGPSVHLRYDISEAKDIEWFYSEITVPVNNDVIGSYYMANGFGEGYFGMQVNSESERRVLFSVWSPFKTDDPKSIPESERIIMLKKGDQVTTGEFGNEGSGGQSYLRYMWKPGLTYGFLLRAQPQQNGSTIFTAWFAPESGQWMLIASFQRPKTSTYLKSLYSFLENFIPETGHIARTAYYGNQWVRPASGDWQELPVAKFTGDATARKNYRKDFAGGTADKTFFLKNCGFFSDFTALDQSFTRPRLDKPPIIDLAKLP